ncbi:MAG TPA: YbdD/YjiX family protein [Gemmatimonadales bacterium]|nr:YbdD/YjiX family protein [Gemmatimonadales bacterium]
MRRDALARLIAAFRRIFGMPDYAAYVAHLRRHHPERALPTEREFFDEYIRARYSGGPTRCC